MGGMGPKGDLGEGNWNENPAVWLARENGALPVWTWHVRGHSNERVWFVFGSCYGFVMRSKLLGADCHWVEFPSPKKRGQSSSAAGRHVQQMQWPIGRRLICQSSPSDSIKRPIFDRWANSCNLQKKKKIFKTSQNIRQMLTSDWPEPHLNRFEYLK